MRQGIIIDVTPADRARLQSIIRDRNSPQKHVWRARIIVLTADGKGTTAITRAVGKGKTVVWRWQERFMHEGVEGLTRDKTRPSRIPPLPAATIDRVVALTNQAPPHEATHWSAPAMAKAVGISPSSVRRIWKGHGLQPHRVRTFKLSNDPKFAEKLKEVIGLYVDPPAHAVVLSLDEKSQIQAPCSSQGQACMGLWLSRAIVGSVATVAAWRVDLLQRLEVAFDDGLQFVCQRRAFEVRR